MNDTRPNRIGIWEREAGSDRYERLPGTWHRWADVAEFPKNTLRQRVLLFGESTARGFFYDPIVTPSLLIQRCLSSCGSEEVEVLDFARTAAQTRHLLEAADAARELAPDIVVIFAGNNWKYELSDRLAPEIRNLEAQAISSDGIPGLLLQRESELASLAHRFVDQICSIYGDVAPVIFVVPESNLKDWRSETLIPTMGGGREREWQRLLLCIQDAVNAEKWERVLSFCDELHALDGGLSDEAYRHKARALLEQGNRADALAAYRRARDVRLWYDIIDPYWLPSAGAAAIRRAAAEHSTQLVDLPQILPHHAVSGIPDRSLFLDSCHLSSDGLKIVSTEIACHVAPFLGFSTTREECRDILHNEPSPIVEAGAQFSAAAAQAEFGQPPESVEVCLQAALASAPQIITTMEAYRSASGSDIPWSMRQRDLSDLANVQRFIDGFWLTGRYRHNHVLVEAISSQICRMRSGARDADRIVRSDWALTPNVRTDLIDPRFAVAWCPAGWEGLIGVHDVQRHYYRAYGQFSCFTFDVIDTAPVDIEVTLRSGTPTEGTARILLNGSQVALIPLSDRWQTSRFKVDSSGVLAGRNDLEIQWNHAELATTPLSVISERTRQGLRQELAVILGEVYSIHATVSAGGA